MNADCLNSQSQHKHLDSWTCLYWMGLWSALCAAAEWQLYVWRPAFSSWERTTVKLNDMGYILFLAASDLSILPQKYVLCILVWGSSAGNWKALLSVAYALRHAMRPTLRFSMAWRERRRGGQDDWVLRLKFQINRTLTMTSKSVVDLV